MNRRHFFGMLGAGAAAYAWDPEWALWVPGRKTYFDIVRPQVFHHGDFVLIQGAAGFESAVVQASHVRKVAVVPLAPEMVGGYLAIVRDMTPDGQVLVQGYGPAMVLVQ